MISLLTDHLIESSLFALLIAALAQGFAKDRAAVRYGLWFAASVKFLVPFSLLVGAGEALRWENAPAVTLDLAWASPGVPTTLQLPAILADLPAPVSMPEVAAPVIAAVTASEPNLETVLFVLWLAGVAFLACRWTAQWLRLAAARTASTPAPLDLPIPARFTRTLFGPGLVGVFRPVLLLPEGIAAHLSPEQMAFVIKHELCHWRRRDNLTGAIHMSVALLFWFHPFVWWIGRRLVTERERACDESVLAAGNDPADYADSILEVCRFYVRSPLTCVAGVAGANLKDRVERIIQNAALGRLGPVKSALLAGVAAGAIALPMAAGLLAPQALAQAAPRAIAPATIIVKKVQSTAASAIRPTRKPVEIARKAPAVIQAATRADAQAIAALPIPVAATGGAVGAEERMARAATPAPAEAPASRAASPPSSTSAVTEEIVVNSTRIRDYVRTRNFVRDYTAPSSFLDQVSRWGAPLCIRTDGLAAGYNSFVTARVREVAGQIGVAIATADDCEVNVSIIFTTQPQALLDHIRTERHDLLGPHYPARRKDLATVTHPIQAWYATGTRDSRGRYTLDSYDWNEPIPGEGPPVYYTLGSHLRTGLASEFASVVIVADIAKVEDYQIGTVADYIAMTALARMKTVDRCQELPSISNVLGTCSEEFKATALSDYDMAYLKAVYRSSSDAPRSLQNAGIGYYMVRILEDQVAAKKAAAVK